jgi:Na+/H+-dicarboxylate symporter
LGIGGLTYEQAKLMAAKAGILLLFFWAISFALILLLPLSFPAWESAAFFSTSLVEIPKPVDFLQLYIPSNPFYSMANNIVPAVVLFSILLGVALMGIKDKEALLGGLSAAAAALVKVTGIIVKLTPVGVFAISASAAGTMTIDEFGRLQVYLVTFNLAALLLTFGILPLLVMAVTPFKYRDIVGMSKDALVTAFTTGNLFVVLTVLTENCKTLFEKYDLKQEKTNTYIDVLVPISFNFPNIGKLLMLLFIMFAGWFTGNTLSLGQYPMFVVSGLLSFFGGVDVALPFMLDLMHIPADMYQLYLVTGVINGRTATLLGAMNLIVFTLLATASLTGVMKIRKKKLAIYATASVILTFGVIIGSKAYLSFAVKNEYLKDVVVANMQLLQNPAPYRLYREVPDRSESKLRNKTPMERIRITETIRVGYHPDHLPYSYFNTIGELVGFDIDMAHRLAEDFEWNIEFIPFKWDMMAKQLKRGDFDIIMSGVPMTADNLKEMKFSKPYMDATLAFVVHDHLRKNYSTWNNLSKQKKPRIAIAGSDYFRKRLKKAFPAAEVVNLDTPRDFFEENFPNLDAILMSAEAGSAWTLLYPRFTTVVPKPEIIKIPTGYPIAGGDQVLADLISNWITLVKGGRIFQDRFNYWIMGEGAERREPRWSVVRNVFGWGIEKPAAESEKQKTE